MDLLNSAKDSILYSMLAAGKFQLKVQLNCLHTRPAVTDKPVRRLRNVCTVYVRAVGL